MLARMLEGVKKIAKVKAVFVVLGAVGFALGVVVAFRSDSANALLGVSVVLLVVAYLGERLENFSFKHGETEFSGQIRTAIDVAKKATEAAGDAVENALESLGDEGSKQDRESLRDAQRAVLADSLVRLKSASYLYPASSSEFVKATSSWFLTLDDDSRATGTRARHRVEPKREDGNARTASLKVVFDVEPSQKGENATVRFVETGRLTVYSRTGESENLELRIADIPLKQINEKREALEVSITLPPRAYRLVWELTSGGSVTRKLLDEELALT